LHIHRPFDKLIGFFKQPVLLKKTLQIYVIAHFHHLAEVNTMANQSSNNPTDQPRQRYYIRSPDVGWYHYPDRPLIGVHDSTDLLGHIKKLGLELPVTAETVWLDTGQPLERRFKSITENTRICILKVLVSDGEPVGWGDLLLEVTIVKRQKALAPAKC